MNPKSDHLVEAWMIILALVKGAVMSAVIIGIAETGFVQSLAVAVCSATVTGTFLVIASWVQSRHTGKKVEAVAEKVELVQEGVDSAASKLEENGGSHHG